MNDFQARLAQLDDYVRGHHDDAIVRDYEEDLFERALEGDAPELAFRAGLGSTLRVMAARGTLELWLTARDVERILASGVRAVLYEFDLENPVPPVIPPGAELLITRIPLDLGGVRSMEAEILDGEGRVLKRMPDVAFDPADGAVFACCEADLARVAANTDRVMTRVWVMKDSGRQILLELPAF